jgi:hypothetical protein
MHDWSILSHTYVTTHLTLLLCIEFGAELINWIWLLNRQQEKYLMVNLIIMSQTHLEIYSNKRRTS